MIGAVFGATATGELGWARKLLNLLDATMLLLMDRRFDAAEFLAGVAATKASYHQRDEPSADPRGDSRHRQRRPANTACTNPEAVN